MATTLVCAKADLDLGVASRVLDLLGSHGCLPESFTFHREGAGLVLKAVIGDLPLAKAQLIVAKVRQIPGVRSAGPVALAAGS